jgi:hypothetical protein
MLYSFFLVLPVPASRFRAPVLAQMTDGLPRFASFCASALPTPPSLISSSLFSSIPSRFASTLLPHPTILCSPLFSCRTSCLRVLYVVSCQKCRRFDSALFFRFSVLFLHLFHRHLAHYYSQWPFLVLDHHVIKDSTWYLSTNFEPTVAVQYVYVCRMGDGSIIVGVR